MKNSHNRWQSNSQWDFSGKIQYKTNEKINQIEEKRRVSEGDRVKRLMIESCLKGSEKKEATGKKVRVIREETRGAGGRE